MKLIEKAMDKLLLNNQNFHNYINYRYNFRKPGLIPPNGYYWKDGLKFMFNESLINDTDWEGYDMDKIQPDHVVLDIGATGGGFSMQASRRCKKVFAVEPLYADILRENIKINDITNITVIEAALGFFAEKELEYSCSVYKTLKSPFFLSFTDIIKLCGGHVDYLKLDCEGGEWYIKPDELRGIKYIEAELHSFKDMPKPNRFLDLLNYLDFSYTTQKLNDEQMMVHASKK